MNKKYYLYHGKELYIKAKVDGNGCIHKQAFPKNQRQKKERFKKKKKQNTNKQRKQTNKKKKQYWGHTLLSDSRVTNDYS